MLIVTFRNSIANFHFFSPTDPTDPTDLLDPSDPSDPTDQSEKPINRPDHKFACHPIRQSNKPYTKFSCLFVGFVVKKILLDTLYLC